MARIPLSGIPETLRGSRQSSVRPRLRPAVKDNETGEVYIGSVSHDMAVDNMNSQLKKAGRPRFSDEEFDSRVISGFVTEDGQFLTREEALKLVGFETSEAMFKRGILETGEE